MPVFKVDIEKTNGAAGATRWTNSYHIMADDIETAALSAENIVEAEIAMHSDRVYFTSCRTSTAAEDGDVFITTPINTVGAYSPGGDQMPLFLALRADFNAVIGRGGRKFYHLLLGETDQAGANWSVTALALVAGALDTMIDALSGHSTPLCSPTGATTYNAFTVYQAVTQHQFRRGSKRKTPILS